MQVETGVKLILLKLAKYYLIALKMRKFRKLEIKFFKL